MFLGFTFQRLQATGFQGKAQYEQVLGETQSRRALATHMLAVCGDAMATETRNQSNGTTVVLY